MDLSSAIESLHTRLSLRSAAESAADAVLLADDTRTWTARELFERVEPDAVALASARAVATGRPVRWRALGADLDSVTAVLACIESGVPFVGVHPRWSPVELDSRRGALASASFVDVADSMPPGPPPSPRVVDACAVLFTSGTSGAARPIVLSRRAFVASALAGQGVLPIASGDRWLLSMPLAHVGGASIVTRCLLARATVVLDPGSFDASAWHARVARHDVTHASIVPTMLARLVATELRSPASLRHLVVGGAACDDVLAERAVALGYPVQRTYGMTETCSMVATESSPLAGGVGAPLTGIGIRLAEGRVRVSGPVLADGVWTASGIAPLTADGEYATSDLGTFDEAGLLHVHGRADDVVITGGENVHPAEVEAALVSIDGVRAAVVFGERDDEWGERVVAAVVLDGVDEHALSAALRTRLAGHSIPRALVVLPELPSLPSGKTDRRATVAMARARASPQR